MAKKDFSEMNVDRVYSQMTEAAAEDPVEPEVKRKRGPYKPRRTYTEEEKAEAAAILATSGKKGMAAARINMAFTSANYDYIQTMARVRGQTMTAFVNEIITLNMAANFDTYQRAIEFRNSL